MRKHCAGNAAQKVENRELVLRLYGRGLFEGDLPGAVSAEAEAGAAVVVGKSVAVERSGALQAVDDNGGGVAEQIDLNLSPSGVVKFVAGREDYSHNRGAVEDLAVPGDVNVFGSHEPVHRGAIVFKPRRVPGFSELVEFLTLRYVFHGRSFPAASRPLPQARLTVDLGGPVFSGRFAASSPGSTNRRPGRPRLFRLGTSL